MSINQRYQRLTYPIHEVEGDIRDKFPQLKNIPGWKGADEKVLRYIIFCYDRGSELIEEHKDLDARKKKAAVEAGFEGLPPKITKVMDLSDRDGLDLIIAYLHFHNHHALTMIMYTEQLFWDNTKLLMSPILEGKDSMVDPATHKKILDAANVRKNLREENVNIKNDLDRLYAEVYSDNKELIEEVKIRRISPETMGEFHDQAV